AAFSHVFTGSICSAGLVTGGCGNLRRDHIYDNRARARDRSSHGAWGRPGEDFANGSWRRAPGGSYRDCNRSSSRIGPWPHCVELLAFIIRSSALGPFDADCHLAGIDRRNPLGLLPAGASRRRRRSDDRVTAQMSAVVDTKWKLSSPALEIM